MNWADTTYHSLLRIAVLTTALTLLFVSGVLSKTTAELSLPAERYLASAVGVTLGVESTELNQITALLTQREQALAAREVALTERELDLGLGSGATALGMNTSTFVLATILFVLLVLIILNYALDYLRSKEQQLVWP